jgi:hypothetical protein
MKRNGAHYWVKHVTAIPRKKARARTHACTLFNGVCGYIDPMDQCCRAALSAPNVGSKLNGLGQEAVQGLDGAASVFATVVRFCHSVLGRLRAV